MQLIALLDQFTAQLDLDVKPNEKRHRTQLGGLMTFILYSACLGYFIYVMQEWVNGDIIPKASQIQTSQMHAQQTFKQGSIQLYVTNLANGAIDPFDSSNLIFMPFLRSQQSGSSQEKEEIYLNYNGKTVYNAQIIEIPEFYINHNGDYSPDYDQSKSGILQVMKCDQKLITQSEIVCASQTTIDKYFSQTSTSITLSVTLNQISMSTGQLQSITKTSSLDIDADTSTKYQIAYKRTLAFVDRNILFSNVATTDFVSDYSILTTVSTNNVKYDSNFKSMIYQTYYMTIDPLETHFTLTFPKLGEVLADISSIVTTILLLGIPICKFNSIQLHNELIDQIILFYYPSIRQVIMSKDIFGRVRSISTNSNNIDLASFKIYYAMLQRRVRQKLMITNIIYEISRLQFIIQTLVDRQTIMKMRDHGIPVYQCLNSSSNEMMVHPLNEDLNQKHDNSVLQNEDLTILSLNHEQ